MRKIVLTYVLFIQLIFSHGQIVNWAKNTWGTNTLNSSLLSVDKMGNSYIAGIYNPKNNTFEGESLDSNGYVFIAKYDINGELIWTDNPKASKYKHDYPSIKSIGHDIKGNTYIAGYFGRNITFGNVELSSINSSNSYVVKYNAIGKVVWVKMIERSLLSKIVVSSNGEVFISGTFNSPLRIDNIVLKAKRYDGVGDFFLAKLNTNGKLKWAKIGKGTWAPNIVLSTDGGLYLAGENQHYVELDNDSLPSKGGIDSYIAKIAKNGSLNWIIPIYSKGYERILTLKTDKNSDIFIIGSFSKKTIFGDTVIANFQASVEFNPFYLIKFDKYGKLKWASKLQGDTFEYRPNNILIDYQNRVFTYGEKTEFQKYPNFKKYGLLRNEYNSTDGLLKSSTKWNNISTPANIEMDSFNNIYIYGSYQKQVRFENIILKSKHYWGRYLSRIHFFNLNMGNNDFALLYPNPNNGLLKIEINNEDNLPLQCKVFDVLGKLVLETKLTSYYLELEMGHLKKGVYLLKLYNNKVMQTFFLIKN